MPGPNKPEPAPEPLSQTQGYGMAPVYATKRDGSQELQGYRFDPATAAEQGIVDTPKPAGILAAEKQIGKPLEPIYKTYLKSGNHGGNEEISYGPPIGYRYDNGKSQYVNFDAGGEYQGTADRQHGIQGFVPLLAAAAAAFLGPEFLAGLGGAGTTGEGIAALGGSPFAPAASLASLTPEALAASELAAYAPASLATEAGIGSLGTGALTAEQLAASELAAYPTASLATEAAAGAGGAGALTPEALAASDLAAYAPAEAAVGTGTGTGIGSTLTELGGSPFAGAGEAATGITSLTPEALTASELSAYPGASLAGEAAAELGGSSFAGAGAAETGVAGLGSGATPSLNQLAASGMGPGSYGALNLPALEAAVAAGTITPEALAAAQLAATGTAGAGITSLAPITAKSLNEGIASGMSPGSVGADLASKGLLTSEQLAAASGVTTAGATPALAELANAGKGLPSTNEMIASGMSPGSAGATGAASGVLTPAQLAAASGATETGITSLAPAAKSVNEMIASGTGAGSAGAAGAASGALTPAELAAASGVVTAGATPALVELANAGKGLPSANEAVASGLSPGSVGAKAAVDGTLTAQELAAASGTAGALNKDGISDLLTKTKDKLLSGSSSSSGSGLGGALGLMALMSMMNKGGGAAPASTATIPELTATRSQLPYDVDKKGVNPNTPYRPGQGGVTYFSPTTYTPTKAAGGGLMSLGQSNLGGYSDGGRLLKGPGDGVSDSIPAIIGRKQPARLANGEFVIPARIVSELGNGSTDAGAKRLYEMMARVQKARRNTKNVAANTKAAKYLPA